MFFLNLHVAVGIPRNHTHSIGELFQFSIYFQLVCRPILTIVFSRLATLTAIVFLLFIFSIY